MNEYHNAFFPLLVDTEENDDVLPVSKELSDVEDTAVNQNNWKTSSVTPIEDLYLLRLDDYTCVVVLHNGQQLGIKGKGYIKVLRGKVSIHGNTFEANKSWMYIGVSAWDPLLLVESEDDNWKDESLSEISWWKDRFNEDVYLSAYTHLLLSQESMPTFAANTVVAFRSCDYMKVEHCEVPVFRAQDNNFTKLVSGLFLYKTGDIHRMSYFCVWDGWEELQRNIIQSTSCSFHSRLFLVCGDRGAGKSTAMRSLCNLLLKFHRHVWLLDTDLGQSEMMPPGMVSLVQLKSFFQSTPLTHETYDSVISYFIGVVTPRERPQIYKEAVQRLALEMLQRAHRTGEPCVINTHGWTTGLGLTILQFLFQLLQPTDVIQVEMKDSASKLSDTWFSDYVCSEKKVQRWKLIRYPWTSNSGDRLSSSERRQLQLIAYFCPQALCFLSPPSSAFTQSIAYQIGNHFAQLPVYKVWLNDMQVYSVDDNVNVIDREHIDTLLLGVVVGLCWNIEVLSSYEKQGGEPLRCFGLGIVKAMERDKTILYISTPVDANKLKQVNTLVVSRFIPLPPAAYLWTGPTEPWFVSWDGLSLISSEMRSRNNIPRRRLSNKKET
ncbi:hypothetical protein GAYE_HPEPCTG121G0141 [Galdieria yellowstonensis]|uniref:Uncharacterized protein n=1 Tax=Galdieria yellowstonensis TaxID=3028027 RepID=A0AAV9I6S1_9RHOD|nr:hypothetical protein GAYE_HPEPCTG121G0141 [Galdieria yellowstonensis]